MTGIAVQAQNLGRRFLKPLRLYGKEIVYYGGVALALAAIAFAAERYRGGQLPAPAAPALPAVELTMGSAEEEEEQSAFCAPEGAEILRAYAADPQWNAALGLWESHEAVDYRLRGDAVASLSAGTVRTVGKSGVYGGFVEVECGEYLLRYASIAPRGDLLPGDSLEPGDIIGSADSSLPAESGLGAHLHLELICKGNRADFTKVSEST